MPRKAKPKEPPILAIDGVPTAEGLIKTGAARRTYDRAGNERIQISVQGQRQIKDALAANAERTKRDGTHHGVNHRFTLTR
jgi:hypothetical protein